MGCNASAVQDQPDRTFCRTFCRTLPRSSMATSGETSSTPLLYHSTILFLYTLPPTLPRSNMATSSETSTTFRWESFMMAMSMFSRMIWGGGVKRCSEI